MNIPKPLQKGDTVAITAASGVVNAHDLAKGILAIKNLGLNVHVSESCLARHPYCNYLAGSCALRAAELQKAFENRDIHGIFMARGGYGAGQILPLLNYENIAKNPKVFVGYSDVTALHIALNQKCNMQTFHGPMVASCFGKDNMHKETLQSFVDMVFGNAAAIDLLGNSSKRTKMRPGSEIFSSAFLDFQGNLMEYPLKVLSPGNVTGILTGGNLTVVASTIGTPYEIDTRGCILFLEDIDEPLYKIDRLLLQLKLAGKLEQAAGFIFGDFSPISCEALRPVISEYIRIGQQKKPALWGLSAGHVSPNFTLPLGQVVSIVK